MLDDSERGNQVFLDGTDAGAGEFPPLRDDDEEPGMQKALAHPAFHLGTSLCIPVSGPSVRAMKQRGDFGFLLSSKEP